MSASFRLGLIALAVFAGMASAQSSVGSCAASIQLSPTGDLVSAHEIGASVGVIDSAALAPLVGRTLSEALTARIPGVSVMRSSGITGTGSRVRLRGPSGIVVTQQPLLYIDGVRADGELQSIALNAGGQAPSRLDDIPADAVDCIIVLRGPATTGRFGTDAAGGIIHVITRRPHVDSRRVRAFLEGGLTRDDGDYPANFGNATSCTRARAALGQCTSSPLRSWSPLEADSPFRTARRLHGGGDATLVAGRHSALGISASASTDGGAFRMNEKTQYAVTTTGGLRADSTFRIDGDFWLLGGRTDLPQLGSLMVSILNSALLGSSIDDPQRRGYRDFPLSVLEQFVTTQRVRRLGGGVHMRWMPSRWLTVNALTGREDSRVRDEQQALLIVSSPPPLRVEATGQFFGGEVRRQQTSASVSATARYGPRNVRLASEIALDYVSETNRRANSSSWVGFETSTKGFLARQSLSSNDRRFLDVGFRRDALDRLLLDLEHPTYPFASAAWDIGREPFFPSGHAVSSLRARAAYGENGDTRGYMGALTLAVFSPRPNGSDAWPVERTRELEGGVDAGFASDRVVVSATLFDKRTSSGLRVAPAPPGIGTGLFQILTNPASWRNRGLEFGVRTRLAQAAQMKADLALTFTTLKNEVTSLGTTPPIVATAYRIQPGYPLFAPWGQRFTVTDANGDGVIVPAEVVGDTASRYLGSPVPTRELGVAPSLTVGRSVTISALVDYRGGFRSVNVTGRLHCNGLCAPLYMPNASLTDQARAVDPVDAAAAWVEDASFVRLRELALAWTIPAAWSRALGARSSSLVLAGRNLLTSTSFTGLDPEGAFFGQTLINQQDVFTLPLPRTVSLRLDVGW